MLEPEFLYKSTEIKINNNIYNMKIGHFILKTIKDFENQEKLKIIELLY